jgi:hypothetical protein
LSSTGEVMSELSCSQAAMRERIRALTSLPVAIEAVWDGDSGGWMVILAAVLPQAESGKPPYRHHDFGWFRGAGGDMRLFNGQDPPWPEARVAAEHGREIAAKLGVPFYFPSPEHPEDDCPRWWEQDRGTPCSRCGIPLLQSVDCPWCGVCHYCHLALERAARQEVGGETDPNVVGCEICGKPGEATPLDGRLCPTCADRFTECQCSSCGDRMLAQPAIPTAKTCSDCVVTARMRELSGEDRTRITTVLAAMGPIAAIKELRSMMELQFEDAVAMVEVIRGGG